jgi:ubiquinone/menaquinone biosynthesis C-methylase UbiE
VDLSSRMIELARQLAEREHVANVTFQQADAQVYPFPDQCFDIAISRTGAMFFGDAPAAFTNIARALRPGGRLVLLAWQSLQRNDWVSAFFAALAAGREPRRRLPVHFWPIRLDGARSRHRHQRPRTR